MPPRPPLGIGTATTEIASVTRGDALVRFGIWVKLPSGSSLATNRLMGTFDVQSPEPKVCAKPASAHRRRRRSSRALSTLEFP